MQVTMTKDEFHDIIMTYIIELSYKESKLLSEGEIVHTPLFDEFLKVLNKVPLGSLKLSYNKMESPCRMKYKKVTSKIDRSQKVVVSIL